MNGDSNHLPKPGRRVSRKFFKIGANVLVISALIMLAARLVNAQSLIDSYNESNTDATVSLNNTRSAVGQVFTPGVSAYIRSAKFYMAKENSPTGTIVAKLYAVSGTPGSTALPTGSSLAVSAGINVTTLSSWPTLALATFDFAADGFAMSAGVPYAIVVEYTGGSATNTIPIGKDNTGTHPGNKVNFESGNWIADAGLDTPFYVFGDVIGSLQFSASSYSVQENAGDATITIMRTGGAYGAIGVTFTTGNGSAVAGADYTAVTQTVNFAHLDTSKTVTIPILEDTSAEESETVNLSLSGPTNGATLGIPASATLTIIDNDPNPAGKLQFSAATYTVNENVGTASITITRTGGTTGAVGATFVTSDGTATAGSDYTAVAQTVNFANGDVSKMVSVPIIDDILLEPDETFNLTLSNATGGALLGYPVTATVTIATNDQPPPGTLQLSAATYSVQENASTATITVTRTGGSAGAVGVSFATSNGTATAGADYTAVTQTVNFADTDTENKTITIPIFNDASPEANETVNLTLSNPTGGATLGSPATAVLTIVDDDVTAPSVIASYSESNHNGTASLNNTRTRIGQVFTTSVSAYLRSAQFYLSREGGPTGSIFAKLYTVTGTPGTTAVPNGLPVAVSGGVDVSTISAWPTLSLVTFEFPIDWYVMSAGESYAITVEYTGTATDLIPASKDSSGEHAGNKIEMNSGTWSADSGQDMIFSVYGSVILPPKKGRGQIISQ